MPRPLVLMVEDDEALSHLLRYNLEAEGYEVASAASGEEADLVVRERLPDLVLLDWMLPGGLSGIELCRRLRARAATARLPIVMLTARGEEDERVRGLALGADDYIVKPFSLAELMARIKAVLRRARPEAVAAVLRAGRLELDRDAVRLRHGGRDIHLGPTEFRLLEFLMQSPGRVFSRAQLLDAAWGQGAFVEERTVDVHIGRLRKALVRAGAPDPVRTVRGAGYALSDLPAGGAQEGGGDNQGRGSGRPSGQG